MDKKLLEKLAIRIGEDFLTLLYHNPKHNQIAKERLIKLFNANQNDLKFLREKMRDYFKDEKEEVDIILGTKTKFKYGEKAYQINVEGCLKLIN